MTMRSIAINDQYYSNGPQLSVWFLYSHSGGGRISFIHSKLLWLKYLLLDTYILCGKIVCKQSSSQSLMFTTVYRGFFSLTGDSRRTITFYYSERMREKLYTFFFLNENEIVKWTYVLYIRITHFSFVCVFPLIHITSPSLFYSHF